MADSTLVGGVLICVTVLGIAVNVTALVVWFCRRRIRRPHLYLLVQLFIVDLLGLFLWTLVSALVALTGSVPSPAVCAMQGYVTEFCELINMHSLLVLAIERLINISKPSRHRVIFVNTVAIILIASLWVFDAVNAMYPLIGWGSYVYFPSQFQCTPDTVVSPSHMNFLFVITYVIPVLGMIACYLVLACRVRAARRKETASGAIVLEERKHPVGDTYTDRLNRQQEKFNMAGMKRKKPRLVVKNKSYTASGYESDSSQSSEDEFNRNEPTIAEKRQYHLAKSDMTLTKTYILVTLVHVSLWLPHAITTYSYTYDVYGRTSETLFAAVTCLTHFPAMIKCLLLMCNSKFRKSFVGVVLCKKRKRKTSALS